MHRYLAIIIHVRRSLKINRSVSYQIITFSAPGPAFFYRTPAEWIRYSMRKRVELMWREKSLIPKNKFNSCKGEQGPWWPFKPIRESTGNALGACLSGRRRQPGGTFDKPLHGCGWNRSYALRLHFRFGGLCRHDRGESPECGSGLIRGEVFKPVRARETVIATATTEARQGNKLFRWP